MEDRAVRVHHAVLDGKALAALGGGERVEHAAGVVGMHASKEDVDMRLDLAGPIAEDVELLVRPDRDPAAQVVLPTADPGDALGFDETAAALLGRGLGTLADDHAGQHVGECAQMSDLLLGTMADRDRKSTRLN